MPSARFLLAALPLLLALGCDSGGKAPSAASNAAAKAAADQAEEDKRIEARKQKRLAEDQAKLDEVAAQQQAVDAICVLPAEIPKKLKLDKACDAVADSHDGFMQRHYGDNPETIEKWNNGKGTQLPMTRAQCVKAGSLEVALCQKNAFDSAPTELKKEIPAIFKTCLEKFGPPAEPAAEPAPQ